MKRREPDEDEERPRRISIRRLKSSVGRSRRRRGVEKHLRGWRAADDDGGAGDGGDGTTGKRRGAGVVGWEGE